MLTWMYETDKYMYALLLSTKLTAKNMETGAIWLRSTMKSTFCWRDVKWCVKQLVSLGKVYWMQYARSNAYVSDAWEHIGSLGEHLCKYSGHKHVPGGNKHWKRELHWWQHSFVKEDLLWDYVVVWCRYSQKGVVESILSYSQSFLTIVQLTAIQNITYHNDASITAIVMWRCK